MKIVCDSCGAKYSIADEKVRGKVFKIRCKKCSEVIVVRGDGTGESMSPQSGAEQAQATAPQAAADTIWHLVVNGEQQGPFAPDQISAMLSAGQIDWEAYGWRDGLENWMHLREIEELVTAITGQAPERPAAAPAAASAEMFGGGGAAAAASAAAGDLFGGGGAPAAAGGGMFASAAAEPAAAQAPRAASSARGRAGGADLFGGGSDDDDVVASKSEAPEAGASSGAMTGARNENSVLFSLSNLQALATKGQPGPTSGISGGGAPAKSGFASGSGSGLIDIRALAEGSAGPSSSSSSSKGIDDLLSIGGPSAFAPALGAPVLVPQRSEGGKLLYVLLGVAALLVLGIIGLVIVIITKTDVQPVAVVAPPPVVQPSLPAAGGLPATPANTGSEAPAPSPNEQPAPTGDEGGDPGRDVRRGGGGPRAGGPTKTGTSAPGTSGPASPGSRGTSEPAQPRPDSRTADLDSLIGSALGQRQTKGAPTPSQESSPAPAARSNLPAQPSRGDVQSAMGAVTPAVRACGGGQTGTAAIRIVFAGSGRVTTASVTSPPFAGTPAGSCMARAVRSARVPPFSNPSLTVTFPFGVR